MTNVKRGLLQERDLGAMSLMSSLGQFKIWKVSIEAFAVDRKNIVGFYLTVVEASQF